MRHDGGLDTLIEVEAGPYHTELKGETAQDTEPYSGASPEFLVRKVEADLGHEFHMIDRIEIDGAEE